MPITDPTLPVRILEGLHSSGVEFVVLHNEQAIGTAELTSDVDIALSQPIQDAIRRVSDSLTDERIIVALVWPYDVGGGASVFFTDPAGTEGAQIDALYDPVGRGRYGLRSDRIVAGKRPGRSYAVPDRLDELLYTARKASVKGKNRDLKSIQKIIDSEFAPELVHTRAYELFSWSAANSLVAVLRGDQMRRSFRPMRWIRSLVRIGNRVVQPIGFWVHVAGPGSEAQALKLQALFGAWLVRTETGRRPVGLAAILWWARVVMPVRLRAGVFFSFSENLSLWPKADLLLSSKQTDADLSASIVEAMARKAVR